MTKTPISRVIFALLVLLFVLVSIGGGIFLVKQRQEIRKKAAVPEGEATVSLSPASGTYQVGQLFEVGIFFNTAGIPISAVAVRLTYPYSQTTPVLEASNLQISSSLLSGGDWSCPVKTITADGGEVKIDVACVNTSPAGFSTSTETLLASFHLQASQVPQINPTVLSFDPSQSIITRKENGQDVLLIPTSTGSYTIAGGQTPTVSPTPTSTEIPTPTLSPQETATPTPPSDLTSTPTPTGGVGGLEPTLTLTPTPATLSGLTIPTPTATVSPQELPETGLFAPTLWLLIGGGLFLLVPLLLRQIFPWV